MLNKTIQKFKNIKGHMLQNSISYPMHAHRCLHTEKHALDIKKLSLAKPKGES